MATDRSLPGWHPLYGQRPVLDAGSQAALEAYNVVERALAGQSPTLPPVDQMHTRAVEIATQRTEDPRRRRKV